jgi:glycosyltransferase involved in cell wall biosynthesis
MSASLRLSLVVATYNRASSLRRLLRDLAQQSLPASEFEVVVVDDGSREPVVLRLGRLALPFALRVVTQANAGAAAARHRGVCEARGELIVIVDDDMELPPTFLGAHLAQHPAGSRRLVLGRMLAPAGGPLPIFERYHAVMLDRLAEDVRLGRVQARGTHLFTGNVSFRRDDYFAAGGFDPSLKQSEDAELGIRLEKAGVEVRLCEEACSIHHSDHTSVGKWMRRAYQYGVWDHHIAQKHPDVPAADPWRFLSMVHPLSRPFLLASVGLPGLMAGVAWLGIRCAQLLDRMGAARPAVAAATLVYGVQYYRGLRAAVGSLASVRTALAQRQS